MEKKSRIYVAGHSGLIGSAILRQLRDEGYENLLFRTHDELDLTDRKATEAFIAEERPEFVFLMAARVGGILANDTYPAEFIFQNIMIQTNLLDLSYRYGVTKLLYPGSPCIYPKISPVPTPEDSIMTGPIEPTNEPYAIAKIAGLSMCRSYNKQYGTDYICPIPANVFGTNDHFDEGGHVVAALMKKFHEARVNNRKSVTVWGTGKPQREFFYVDDLADACIFLMHNYSGSDIINVGTGRGTSIAELAGTIAKLVGFDGNIEYDTTKPDGIPIRLIDSSRMTALGWKPTTPLEDALRFTYEWYKKTLQG